MATRQQFRGSNNPIYTWAKGYGSDPSPTLIQSLLLEYHRRDLKATTTKRQLKIKIKHNKCLCGHTINFEQLCYTHTNELPGSFKISAWLTQAPYTSTTSPILTALALLQPCRAPRLLVSCCTRSTSTSPCAATTRFWLHALYVNLAVRRDYSSPAARALRRPRRAPRLLVSGRTRSTSTSPCAATTRLRRHALYIDLAVRRDYSSPTARALR
jgi:hypothetical protein